MMQILREFKNLILWCVLFTTDTASQLYFKLGADATHDSPWLFNTYLFIGYASDILAFILWMQILKTTRLSIALAVTSLLYVTVGLVSYFFLQEPLTKSLILGTLLITMGVGILGYVEGRKEKPEEKQEELGT